MLKWGSASKPCSNTQMTILMPLFKLFFCPAKHNSGGIAGSRGKGKVKTPRLKVVLQEILFQSSSGNTGQSDRCSCAAAASGNPPLAAPPAAARPLASRSLGNRDPSRAPLISAGHKPGPGIPVSGKFRRGRRAGITRYHGNGARPSPNGPSFRQAAPRGPVTQRHLPGPRVARETSALLWRPSRASPPRAGGGRSRASPFPPCRPRH